MEITIITGLSGSGKSQVANIFEDMGYFCIDNLPPTLIPTFAEMAVRLDSLEKVAIVTDMRTGNWFSGIFERLKELDEMEIPYKILFLDADDAAITRRYRESRRAHPLSGVSGSPSPIADAIAEERKFLAPIREVADYYINTTHISVDQLRQMIESMFLENANDSLHITCMSFGFKYSIPMESNLVFDVRYLPNPFYIEELKIKTGLDDEVRDYVFSFAETDELIDHIYNLIDYLLPLYKREGKTRLIISVGCTGGKHRSVAITERLAKHIEGIGYPVSTMHRDIAKLV